MITIFSLIGGIVIGGVAKISAMDATTSGVVARADRQGTAIQSIQKDLTSELREMNLRLSEMNARQARMEGMLGALRK